MCPPSKASISSISIDGFVSPSGLKWRRQDLLSLAEVKSLCQLLFYGLVLVRCQNAVYMVD